MEDGGDSGGEKVEATLSTTWLKQSVEIGTNVRLAVAAKSLRFDIWVCDLAVTTGWFGWVVFWQQPCDESVPISAHWLPICSQHSRSSADIANPGCKQAIAGMPSSITANQSATSFLNTDITIRSLQLLSIRCKFQKYSYIIRSTEAGADYEQRKMTPLLI